MIIAKISGLLKIKEKQVAACVELLNEGATIPFIARYRKEKTGELDEEQIRQITESKSLLEKIIDRKKVIAKSLVEHDFCSDELEQKLADIWDLGELEDFYLPYKPKRKTKADTALENGLAPLAAGLMKQSVEDPENYARNYIRGPYSAENEVLTAAVDVMAQWINENAFIRKVLRRKFNREAIISAKLADGSHQDAHKFRDFEDFSASLKRTPSHRLLALLRGDKEGILKVKVGIDKTEAFAEIGRHLIRRPKSEKHYLEKAIKQAYQKSLASSLAAEALKEAREIAEETAIKVFANNAEQLLSSPPLRKKRVLGIDPGFKSGCKLVCLDENGKLLHNENIYPHPPQKEYGRAKAKIAQLVEAYKLNAIAVGNGTAGRETEKLCADTGFKSKVQIFSVSEAGASVYSASSVARQEFPSYDITVRGAVSIGRRLQDPMAELVKIEPKAIGVGQYQHDVDQKKLNESLGLMVMLLVNRLGVELNTASWHLLQYVSGLGPSLAKAIVEHREEHGPFAYRKDLIKVKGLGAKAFEQAAGFLRVSDSANPLDRTAVHPESYGLAASILLKLQLKVEAILDDPKLLVPVKAEMIDVSGESLLKIKGVLDELKKAGRDERGTMRAFQFDPTIRKMSDLKVGMILPGLVNNLTKFGAFVDIGIKESGLIHVSEMADRFISDPAEIVKLQEALQVKVILIDIERKRIQLSLKF